MVEQPVMTVEAVREFLARALPQISGIYAIEAVGAMNTVYARYFQTPNPGR
jgi:hypothetical protein